MPLTFDPAKIDASETLKNSGIVFSAVLGAFNYLKARDRFKATAVAKLTGVEGNLIFLEVRVVNQGTKPISITEAFTVPDYHFPDLKEMKRIVHRDRWKTIPNTYLRILRMTIQKKSSRLFPARVGDPLMFVQEVIDFPKLTEAEVAKINVKFKYDIDTERFVLKAHNGKLIWCKLPLLELGRAYAQEIIIKSFEMAFAEVEVVKPFEILKVRSNGFEYEMDLTYLERGLGIQWKSHSDDGEMIALGGTLDQIFELDETHTPGMPFFKLRTPDRGTQTQYLPDQRDTPSRIVTRLMLHLDELERP